MIIPGRNDNCWCGSGNKFKHCHLNRHLDSPRTADEIIKENKRIFGKKYCLHPLASGRICRPIIGKAHTLQKRGGLNLIARDNHVYSCLNDFSSYYYKSNGKVYPHLMSINKASTFSGFCNFHDNEIFEPIEKRALEICRKHIFLLSYRGLSREIYT